MSYPIRRSAFAAALCVAASLVPAAAGAQTVDSTRRSGFRPRIAAGIDAMLYDDSQRVPSVHGVVGVEWLGPRSPFSARFDLSYFRRDREFEWRNCEGACRFDDRYTVVGLSAAGRYAFRSGAAVRPYVVSGFGVYGATTASSANFVCVDFRCAPAPGQSETDRRTSIGLGFDAGFGFGFPIGGREFTLEFLLRQHGAAIRQGYTMPVTLGIRF